MNSNPFLGVFFHWLGGLASGSFYVPYRGVKKWAWETFWLVGGFFSWIIAPWILASLLTYNLLDVLRETPSENLIWAYFFGAMWGLGGLTFGLTMRYLGMSLGMAVALGYCAAFGTLMPPIFQDVAHVARAARKGAPWDKLAPLLTQGDFVSKVLMTHSGQVILFGVVVCLGGIALAGLAGMSKEREMSEVQKKASIKEFSFKKGVLVATFSGVMSASFAYGLAAGDPIKELSLKYTLLSVARADGVYVQTPVPGKPDTTAPTRIKDATIREAIKELKDPGLKQVVVEIKEAGGDPLKYLNNKNNTLWQGLPVLVVVLLGGFTTNFIWCVLLNVKNKTGYQYFSPTTRKHFPGRQDETIIETATDAPGEEVAYSAGTEPGEGRASQATATAKATTAAAAAASPGAARVPMLANYLFCALAGTTWYMQFFCYTMGETQMGRYKFSSWTLHMASIIIFSTLWGIALREWKGASRRTILLVGLALAVLIGSTVVVGYGNYLGTLH